MTEKKRLRTLLRSRKQRPFLRKKETLIIILLYQPNVLFVPVYTIVRITVIEWVERG